MPSAAVLPLRKAKEWLRFRVCPGYRHPYTGVLTNVGERGYSWSSTVSGTDGLYLSMNATWVNPSNANNRAHGFQVRCLQHLSALCSYTRAGGNRTILTGGCPPECLPVMAGRQRVWVNSAAH